jgi:hypothetical protein
LRASPTAWRTIFAYEKPPSQWTVSRQVAALVELGVARPQEFGLALLHLVDPDKAQVLRLGHWPRTSRTQATPHTTFALQLTKLLLSIASTYAPGDPVTAILLEQRYSPLHKVKYACCGIRIEPGGLSIGVRIDSKWNTVVRCPLENENRHIIAYLGVNHFKIPPKVRIQLKKSGFSLLHVS